MIGRSQLWGKLVLGKVPVLPLTKSLNFFLLFLF